MQSFSFKSCPRLNPHNEIWHSNTYLGLVAAYKCHQQKKCKCTYVWKVITGRVYKRLVEILWYLETILCTGRWCKSTSQISKGQEPLDLLRDNVFSTDKGKNHSFLSSIRYFPLTFTLILNTRLPLLLPPFHHDYGTATRKQVRQAPSFKTLCQQINKDRANEFTVMVSH